jgi:hypothetical protein
MKRIDENTLIGQKYNLLTVLKVKRKAKGVDRNGNPQYRIFCYCECECGDKKWIQHSLLKSNHTKSCGCYVAISNKINALNSVLSGKTHGLSHHPLYLKLYSYWNRCYNPKAIGYHNYGGRGISMVEEWNPSKIGIQAVYNFMEWVKENPYPAKEYSFKYTIDRIDNDGPYAPWNCRWADKKTQRANQRSKKQTKLDKLKFLEKNFLTSL